MNVDYIMKPCLKVKSNQKNKQTPITNNGDSAGAGAGAGGAGSGEGSSI